MVVLHIARISFGESLWRIWVGVDVGKGSRSVLGRALVDLTGAIQARDRESDVGYRR